MTPHCPGLTLPDNLNLNYVSGPLQARDHVDAADGVQDEVGRQDQGAEDQQPGFGSPVPAWGPARADSDRPGLSTLGLEFSLRLSGDNKCCTRQSGDNAQPQAEWG